MATPKASSGSAAVGRIESLSLYQEFLAEREELLRHKWIMSEQAGVDVGFEAALADWAQIHRANWRRDRAKVRENG